MPRKIIFACLAAVAAVILFVASASADVGNMALIKARVVKELCIDEYHADNVIYRRDPLSIRAVIIGDRFYSRVEDVYFYGGDSTTLYHIGFLKPDRAVITHNFEKGMKKRFEDGPVISDTLTLPPDCTPKFEPSTPRKELMLDTVVKTMQYYLEDLVRKGIAQYPKDLTLVIADFDVDYQMTYVLAEQTGKVYRLRLHDPQDFYSDEYEREGRYPLNDQYDITGSFSRMIRKHGVKREITLDVP